MKDVGIICTKLNLKQKPYCRHFLRPICTRQALYLIHYEISLRSDLLIIVEFLEFAKEIK